MDHSGYEDGLLFAETYAVVRRRIHAVLDRFELTPSDWSILVIVTRSSEGIRLANVARQMHVKAPLVTMLANKLIERDLLSRLPHYTDGRAKLLVITPVGKRLINRLSQSIDTEVGQLLKGMTPTQISVFRASLQTILQNADHT